MRKFCFWDILSGTKLINQFSLTNSKQTLFRTKVISRNTLFSLSSCKQSYDLPFHLRQSKDQLLKEIVLCISEMHILSPSNFHSQTFSFKYVFPLAILFHNLTNWFPIKARSSVYSPQSIAYNIAPTKHKFILHLVNIHCLLKHIMQLEFMFQ